MLEEAEAEAARLGYTQAYLDTFTFQSPDLYLRAGYEVFGQLDGFPAGGNRLFMRKTLQSRTPNVAEHAQKGYQRLGVLTNGPPN